MKSLTPAELVKRSAFISLVPLAFISNELLCSRIGLDLAHFSLKLSEMDLKRTISHTYNPFFSDVRLAFSDQRLDFHNLIFGIITVLVMIFCLTIQIRTTILLRRNPEPTPLQHPTSWAEFKRLFKKPDTIDGIIRYYMFNLIALVIMGFGLDYFLFYWRLVESQLFSIKSLIDTMLFNPQLIPEGGIDVVRPGELIIASDLHLVSNLYIVLLVLGSIVILLSFWNLIQLLFTSRQPPEGSY